MSSPPPLSPPDSPGRPAASLDPADWSAFRALAHRVVDDLVDSWIHIGEGPVWRQVPVDIQHQIEAEPIPLESSAAEAVYQQVKGQVMPYPSGCTHPRFWGWVQGSGLPIGALADLLSSGLNAHLAGMVQAPLLVETQVLTWLAQLMGMPSQTEGVLVSGGTMANVLGLAAALHASDPGQRRQQGLQNRARPVAIYGSVETHSWIKKAVRLMGIGEQFLRLIPVDAEYRMRLDELERQIAADRNAGIEPVCVIGTAGTVNTGATDDLEAISAFCHREQLWFHIDGAFGALARLSPELASRVRGLELGDSLAFDLHKWMYLPYECACTLVRHPGSLENVFQTTPSYLASFERGPLSQGLKYADRGVDLSRSFKALKVWMAMKTHGVRAIGAAIRANVEQAAYLARRVDEHAELELMAPAPLNIVCFRFVAPALGDERLDAINREILLRVQESGVTMPSSTRIDGHFCLRCAITNHRSQLSDFDLLLDAVLQHGRDLVSAEYGGTS